MSKNERITISLPTPVMKWLQDGADKRFTPTPEHIRGLIIELYTNAQSVHAFPRRPAKQVLPLMSSTHKTAKPLHATRSGYRGVHPYGKRWAAVISREGHQERIGVYDTPEEAARAYDAFFIARAGGDQSAAVNAIAERAQAAQVVDAPFVDKLRQGQGLSDVEMAAWKRASASTPVAPSSALPMTTGAPMPFDDGGSIVTAPVRRQLRRGSAAIDRPAEEPEPDDHER